MKFEEMTLDVAQQIDVKADIGDVFKAVLHRFGEGSTNPDGESMQMILEQWPGGRWFRDRGNGIGHLWGHVQVIKPPRVAGIERPHVHVVPRTQPRRDQAGPGPWRDQGHTPSPRARVPG